MQGNGGKESISSCIIAILTNVLNHVGSRPFPGNPRHGRTPGEFQWLRLGRHVRPKASAKIAAKTKQGLADPAGTKPAKAKAKPKKKTVMRAQRGGIS